MTDDNQLQLLTRQLNEARRKNQLMATVTFELNKVLSLPDKLQNILKILNDQFYIHYSLILLPDKELKNLVVQCSYGYDKDHTGFSIPFGTGIVGLAAVKRLPINITGIRRKKDYLAVNNNLPQQAAQRLPGLDNPESQIAIPLIANNELVAVLLAESHNLSVFSKEDEAFLITLSQAIAVSIQNSVLFDSMEDIIANRTEELRKSNQTKDRLFSVISHDLRGPITSFQSIAKLVGHYNKQNEREKIDLLSQRIDQSVNKLNTLLNNLLNWALAQTKEIQCHPASTSLSGLLDDIIEVHNDQLLQKELTIHTEYSLVEPIIADYDLLTAVFRNLLSNAIKYSPRGSVIKLKTHKNDSQAVIEIEDNGVGIAPEKLSSLFEAGEKKNTCGTENEKGTGLGLVVAKEFVKMHGGAIAVDSILNKKTIVRVTLPIS